MDASALFPTVQWKFFQSRQGSTTLSDVCETSQPKNKKANALAAFLSLIAMERRLINAFRSACGFTDINLWGHPSQAENRERVLHGVDADTPR
jgi:hypothetical protein